jgi:transposase
MNMKKRGRKVDLSNINVVEIEKWMQANKHANSIIKCQSILALNRNVKMQEVCNVMGVTREAVRLWKEQLRSGGLTELLKKGKVGKRSKLTETKLRELRKITRQPPSDYGLDGQKWTGILVKAYVSRNWKIEVSIRTAHQWFNKAKSKTI